MSSPAPDLSVCIAGKIMPNPVGVASGVFGFGSEYDGLTDLLQLGAIYTKAVTREPRAGNVPPRLVETDAGMINAIGLANPGLEAFVRDKAPAIARMPCPVVVNVAGATDSDYVAVTEAVDSLPGVWGVELNVSCPNVDRGGMSFGTNARVLADLTARVRRVCTKPLIVKLSPNVTDIAEMARAAAGAGADALSCVNTYTAMKIDIHARRPVLQRGTGGLSGPAIRPLGVAAVWRVARTVDVPVIGIGGISSASHALEYLLAGAHAVQIGTAVFNDPEAPERVCNGIRDYMTGGGFLSIDDLHGLF